MSAKPLADIAFSSKSSQSSSVVSIPSPMLQEQSAFYDKLARVKAMKLPATLSVQPEHCRLFVPAARLAKYPVALNTFYDTDMVSAQEDDVRTKCENVFSSYSATETQIRNLERDTRQQSNSKLWFAHRAGRVTASILKQCLGTNSDKPSISLVRRVCYPLACSFHSAATKWGCDHEKEALLAYKNVQSAKHDGLEVLDSGLWIHRVHNWLAASPDGIVFCECHGWGCIEIKCPYKCVTRKISELEENDKTFCLSKTDTSYKLKRNHPYYYQVSMHMECTSYDYRDFVLWGPDASQINDSLYIERLTKDSVFFDALLPKINEFVLKCVLPELLCKLHTRMSRCVVTKKIALTDSSAESNTSNIENTVLIEPNNRHTDELHDDVIDVCAVDNMQTENVAVCYCKQPFSNEIGTLKCTADVCANGRYFHVNCLGYKRLPKQDGWVCFGCRAELARLKKRKRFNIDVPSIDN